MKQKEADIKLSDVRISDLVLWFVNLESNLDTCTINFDCLSDEIWCQFLQQIRYYRLYPIVMSKLEECAIPKLPESVLNIAKAEVSEHKKRLLIRHFELLKISKILASEGVEAVFYKGSVLSLLAYDSLEGRMFDDLDIWVKKCDYLEPKEILKKHGYSSLEYPTLSAEKERNFRYYAGEYTLTKPQGKVCIDVHHQILGGGFLGAEKTLDAAWERCILLQVAGHDLKTLCSEDLLIYLCLNGLKDGWASLKVICDIDRLIRNSSMDWTAVIDESKLLRVSRALQVGLHVSQNLLETPLPNRIDTYVFDDPRAKDIANKFSELLIHQTNQIKGAKPIYTFFLILRTLDSWSERRNYFKEITIRFWRLLVTVNSQDLQVVRLPKALFGLYYPIRIFRVLFDSKIDTLRTVLK